MTQQVESGGLSCSNYCQLAILFVIFMIIRYFYKRSENERMKRQLKEQSFLVPKEGGALQRMKKDNDGNIALKLAKKIKLTGDTYIFRFSFQDPDWTFGLPIGGHVIFNAVIPTKEKPEGDMVSRKYTPTSAIINTGYVDFVIKIYRKNVHPRFPDGGLFTQYLESLEAGATMLMEGPMGRLAYQGAGKFLINRSPMKKTRIGLVAGGTGITPCYQVIQAALNGDDGTTLAMVFGSRTVEDILLKDELDQFEANHKDRFHLYYTVDVAPQHEWKYGTGFMTKDMLKQHLPEPSDETIILFCGPPVFEDMMKNHLKDLGYGDDMQFKF